MSQNDSQFDDLISQLDALDNDIQQSLDNIDAIVDDLKALVNAG